MGKNILSEIVIFNKYARYQEALQRRETWEEIVTRNMQMHIKKFPSLTAEIKKYYQFVFDKKVVPSMRSLQFSGKPIELAPSRIYNCAYTAIDHYRAFSEIMFLLLGGTGVGFSVQARHISQLPEVTLPQGEARYVVQDSAVGWSDAVKRVMKAYLVGDPKPRFDFSDIREEGQPLKTSGGSAPGPEPLKRCLFEVENILTRYHAGSRLQSIDVFDIVCHIADAVRAGGTRRAATICLFDKHDYSMLTAKTGEWWYRQPQRMMANVSAVLHRETTDKDDFDRIFKMCQHSGSGEPGFIWTNNYDYGVNPCAEISLKSCSFCNLTEVNVSTVTSQEDLEARVEAASFIGTLQAAYTDFFYLRPVWKKNAERDALLGVSLTGICSLKEGNGGFDFVAAAKVAVNVNQTISDVLGINPAKRVTTVKPSGTTSLVVGTSSGVHGWYSPYYIRRMQINKKENLYAYLVKVVPELMEDHYIKTEDTAVFSFPMKAPDNAVMRDEAALGTLERVRHYQDDWITSGHIEGDNKHNVSCTINVRENEWDAVRGWMWDFREHYTGISLLPYDNGTYEQTPFEEIDEEKYNEMREYLVDKDIDLTMVKEVLDNTDLQGEIACGGGSCEIH